MRISNLRLKNLRLFGEKPCNIDFSSRNIVVLLGNNGTGKSTILDAISYLISPFISQFPNIADRQIPETDVARTANGLAFYLEIEGTFESATGEHVVEKRYRKGFGKAPESDLKEIKRLATDLKEAIVSGSESVELPIFAYYGTGRGNINAPERRRNFQKVFERWNCYTNALLPSTDFKTFFAWFDLMEDEERRQREKLRDFDYKLPALETVRRALANFVGDKYTTPRIEIHPLRFVMSEIGEEGRDLRIEQMSDGYKIMIAMISDIASRAAEANPQMENPLLSKGIILIDEIDLHLHPLWQREIAGQLSRTFPNIQFILSTHSPVVIAGASKIAQVVNIADYEQADPSESRMGDLSLLDVGQLLLSNLFGLESLKAPVWDKTIARRNELLAKGQISQQEKAELEKLNSELSVLQSGCSPQEIQVAKLLQKLVAKFGLG